MGFRIIEAIEQYKRNTGEKMNITILTEKVFGNCDKSNYIIIYRISKGETERLSAEFINKLCKVLGCTADFLIGK